MKHVIGILLIVAIEIGGVIQADSLSISNWETLPLCTDTVQFPAHSFSLPNFVIDSGSCDVAISVGFLGNVTRALILRSTGHRELDLAARKYAESIRFRFEVETNENSRILFCYLPYQKVRGSADSFRFVHERAQSVKDAEIQVSFRAQANLLDRVINSVPDGPEEFRTVDFSAIVNQQPIISISPDLDTTVPVWLQVLVDRSARPVKSIVAKSSGTPYKDTLALMALPSLKFEPALAGGHLVSNWMTMKVAFNVDQTINPDWTECDIPAEMIETSNPEYPLEARLRGLEGIVWIKSLIDTTGKIVESKVMKSSGVDGFDYAAIKAAARCKFKPGMLDGQPVRMWVSYKVTFALSK